MEHKNSLGFVKPPDVKAVESAAPTQRYQFSLGEDADGKWRFQLEMKLQ
ncbi:MAG: hypothetical protein AAGG44_02075 [Planctomycetota bacterium]